MCIWPDCSWYLARESSTKDNFTSNPEGWEMGEKMQQVDKTNFAPNFLKTIIISILITTHLASGTSVLPPPTMCFWNKVQGLPVYDGNTADCGHEGSSAAASLSHCEHLRQQIQSELSKCTGSVGGALWNMNSPFNMRLYMCKLFLRQSCSEVFLFLLKYDTRIKNM